MRTEMIDVRGGMFRVQLREEGAGEPLLFLHGSGGQRDWAPFLSQLAQHYRVLQPNHPGWGDSEGLEHLDDMVDMALFYLDFLDALGLASVHVVGHSLGGMLAAEIAALGRPYVRTLTLASPAGLWLDEAPPLDFFVASRDELNRAVYFDPAMASTPPDPTTEEGARLIFEQQKARAAAAKFLWPIWDKGLKKRLHRIDAPTLILWGEHDGLIPPVYASEFQNRIAGSRIVSIPQTAHVPQIERPEEFVSAIRGFIEGAVPA